MSESGGTRKVEVATKEETIIEQRRESSSKGKRKERN